MGFQSGQFGGGGDGGSGGSSNGNFIINIPIGDRTTPIPEATNIGSLHVPYGMVILGVSGGLESDTSGSFTVGMRKNGNSILTDPIIFESGEKSSLASVDQPVIATPNTGAQSFLTFDCLDDGGGTAAGLSIQLRVRLDNSIADEPFEEAEAPAPDSITGLIRWGEARTLGLADGDPISTYTDLSTEGNDGTQTGADRPLLDDSGSSPSIRFGGGSSPAWFNLPDLSALTEGHYFLLCKMDHDPADFISNGGIWEFGTDNASDDLHPYTDGAILNGFGSTARKTVGDADDSLASWHIFEVWSATNDWGVRLNGVEIFTTGSNTVAFSSTPKLGQSVSGSYSMLGNIAADCLYDNKLTEGDADVVVAYLNTIKAELEA